MRELTPVHRLCCAQTQVTLRGTKLPALPQALNGKQGPLYFILISYKIVQP